MGLAKQLNNVQKVMSKIKYSNSGLSDSEKENNERLKEEFFRLTGRNVYQFESEFLSKWVKEFSNRNGWHQIDLDSATNKSLVFEKQKGSTKLDQSHLVIDSTIGEDKMSSLFKFSKQSSIMSDKGIVNFPRILQTRKAVKDYTSEESDFAYNADVTLWIRGSIKDGKATYTKVDMENFNPKMVSYALPLIYQLPVIEKKKSTNIWAEIDEEGQTASDDTEGIFDSEGATQEVEDKDINNSESEDSPDDSDEEDSPYDAPEDEEDNPFASDELSPSDNEDIFGAGGILDPDTLDVSSNTGITEADSCS